MSNTPGSGNRSTATRAPASATYWRCRRAHGLLPDSNHAGLVRSEGGNAMTESSIQDEVPTYENYEDDFDGYSLGTEEELHGPAIRVAANAPKLVAVVRHNHSEKVLVEV